MSLRLERIPGATLIRAALTVALAAAMLAASPAAAEARTGDKSAPSVVVRPGDSLWSISEGLLGPNASPRRVMNCAERIYALNRGRIGADPDLIFVGQELSLPPALSEGATVASAAPKTAHAAEATPRDRAAKGTTGKAPKPVPRTVAGGADAKGGEAPGTAARQEAEPVGLPALQDEAAAAPVPAVRAVASDGSPTSPVASFFIAVGVAVAVAVALAVAVEMALDRDERYARREAPRAPGLGRRAVFVGSGGTASSPGTVRTADTAATRGRAPRAKAKVSARAVPRNGLALGAHNPEVRRAPRRARATMRARRLRPRLRQGRGVSARGDR